MESHIFVINTSCETYQYTVQYPHDVSLPIVWMRSVHRDLLKMNIPKSTREQFFLACKYQRAVSLNNALRSGPASYGIRLALQPTVSKVKKIADAIYTSPALLTNTPDWTLRYRRGRLHAAGEHLALPNQKVSVTNIDYETYPRYEDLDNAIIEKLQQVRLEVIATKIRIGEVLEKKTIAAIVYFRVIL